jgi:hypothetical protein
MLNLIVSVHMEQETRHHCVTRYVWLPWELNGLVYVLPRGLTYFCENEKEYVQHTTKGR